jgi:hypothetical protein
MAIELEALDGRVKALEGQLNELLLKLKIIKWLAAGVVTVLSAFSLSFPLILKSELRKAYDHSEMQIREALEKDLSQAKQEQSQLEQAIQAAKAARPITVGPNNSHDAAPDALLVHPHPAPALSRTERQIDAFGHSIQSPPDGIYTTSDLTNDIGQLVNCVALFIDDMGDQHLSSTHDRKTAAIYAQLFGLTDALEGRLTTYDDPAHDNGAAWHSKGWPGQFRQALEDMQASQQSHSLSYEDLKAWTSKFNAVRDGLWGPTIHPTWPEPLKGL